MNAESQTPRTDALTAQIMKFDYADEDGHAADDFRELARAMERELADLKRDFDACYTDFKEQVRLRAARDADNARLREALEACLRSPGIWETDQESGESFGMRINAALVQS